MNRYIAFLSIIVSIVFSSCSHTESVEPSPAGDCDLMTLNVFADEAYRYGGSTRANSEHSLRLIATLYSYSEGAATFIERREQKADGLQTEISFNLPNSGTYLVTVFADYILSSENAVNGKYADKYYDTSNAASIKAKTGNSDFFNNDNRDCFVGKCVFVKSANAVNENISLRRPTSRVTIATEDRVEGINSLVINTCSHISSYNFNLENNATAGTVSSSEAVALDSENVSVNNPSTGNLFYFYTFAGAKAGSDTNGGNRSGESLPALDEISFTITPANGYKVQGVGNKCVIAGDLIKPVANYKITAKGKNWVVIDDTYMPDAVIVNIESPADWITGNDKPL